ncbi:hypothetical protein [uncultured Ruegeria sp.]|uniref:hypothetical protein n=1 Tax=uncultured Ruegeria sp. TaxID=259304 RepID=UPI0026283CD5|nr:hypothetical protein [uncultured Ruegeria sp.]
MTAQDLFTEAERLEQKLHDASPETRLALQPSVSMVLNKMRAQRVQIPSRLRRLDAALCEEALEARFDNIPV